MLCAAAGGYPTASGRLIPSPGGLMEALLGGGGGDASAKNVEGGGVDEDQLAQEYQEYENRFSGLQELFQEATAAGGTDQTQTTLLQEEVKMVEPGDFVVVKKGDSWNETLPTCYVLSGAGEAGDDKGVACHESDTMNRNCIWNKADRTCKPVTCDVLTEKNACEEAAVDWDWTGPIRQPRSCLWDDSNKSCATGPVLTRREKRCEDVLPNKDCGNPLVRDESGGPCKKVPADGNAGKDTCKSVFDVDDEPPAAARNGIKGDGELPGDEESNSPPADTDHEHEGESPTVAVRPTSCSKGATKDPESLYAQVRRCSAVLQSLHDLGDHYMPKSAFRTPQIPYKASHGKTVNGDSTWRDTNITNTMYGLVTDEKSPDQALLDFLYENPGAAVNARSEDGRGAVWWAWEYKRPFALAALKAYCGDDVAEQEDAYGKKPRELCARAPSPRYTRMGVAEGKKTAEAKCRAMAAEVKSGRVDVLRAKILENIQDRERKDGDTHTKRGQNCKTQPWTGGENNEQNMNQFTAELKDCSAFLAGFVSLSAKDSTTQEQATKEWTEKRDRLMRDETIGSSLPLELKSGPVTLSKCVRSVEALQKKPRAEILRIAPEVALFMLMHEAKQCQWCCSS
eukprot:g15463.t1